MLIRRYEAPDGPPVSVRFPMNGLRDELLALYVANQLDEVVRDALLTLEHWQRQHAEYGAHIDATVFRVARERPTPQPNRLQPDSNAREILLGLLYDQRDGDLDHLPEPVQRAIRFLNDEEWSQRNRLWTAPETEACDPQLDLPGLIATIAARKARLDEERKARASKAAGS